MNDQECLKNQINLILEELQDYHKQYVSLTMELSKRLNNKQSHLVPSTIKAMRNKIKDIDFNLNTLDQNIKKLKK